MLQQGQLILSAVAHSCAFSVLLDVFKSQLLGNHYKTFLKVQVKTVEL